MTNCTLILPADTVDHGNTLAEAMGWGPGNYSIMLSPTGSDPATHYALHLAVLTDEFVTMLSQAGQGEMPQSLIDAGYPYADFVEVVSALIAIPGVPFEQAVSTHNLQRVILDD